MKASTYRAQTRTIINRIYFEPHEQVALWTLTGKAAPPGNEPYSINLPADPDAIERGREERFRIGVVTAYDYTCALTGYRFVTLYAGTIVDAAHIHPFAASRNNDPDNGLALSKNAHWLLDNGLWSIENDYTVITADRHFAESGDAALLLAAMKGRQIRLPNKQNVWPARQHLEWHRNHTFLG